MQSMHEFCMQHEEWPISGSWEESLSQLPHWSYSATHVFRVRSCLLWHNRPIPSGKPAESCQCPGRGGRCDSNHHNSVYIKNTASSSRDRENCKGVLLTLQVLSRDVSPELCSLPGQPHHLGTQISSFPSKKSQIWVISYCFHRLCDFMYSCKPCKNKVSRTRCKVIN